MSKFTRSDIHAVMTEAGTNTDTARKLTALIIEALAAAMAAGKVIELRGLGTLAMRERKARTMHNPRTMASVDVPARRVVFFKPGEKKRALSSREAL